MRVLSTGGLEFPADLSDRDATRVGRHWNAVRRYLDTGYDDDLREFDDVQVAGKDQAGRAVIVTLETDVDAIDRHAIRGDIRFESIYDEVQ